MRKLILAFINIILILILLTSCISDYNSVDKKSSAENERSTMRILEEDTLLYKLHDINTIYIFNYSNNKKVQYIYDEGNFEEEDLQSVMLDDLSWVENMDSLEKLGIFSVTPINDLIIPDNLTHLSLNVPNLYDVFRDSEISIDSLFIGFKNKKLNLDELPKIINLKSIQLSSDSLLGLEDFLNYTMPSSIIIDTDEELDFSGVKLNDNMISLDISAPIISNLTISERSRGLKFLRLCTDHFSTYESNLNNIDLLLLEGRVTKDIPNLAAKVNHLQISENSSGNDVLDLYIPFTMSELSIMTESRVVRIKLFNNHIDGLKVNNAIYEINNEGIYEIVVSE